MPHLVAALPPSSLGEHPIHRARGAEVCLLLKQRRIGRAIATNRHIRVADGAPFGRDQCARRRRAGPPGRRAAWAGAAEPARDTPMRHNADVSPFAVTASIRSVSSVSRGVRGIEFFWEGDDRLGPLQLPLEPAVGFQLLHTRVDRTWGRAAPTSPHVPQGALLTLPSSPPYTSLLGAQRPQLARPLVRLLRMRSRYSAVNRRRWAFAGTSGSGAVAADVAVGPIVPSIKPSPDTNLNKEVSAGASWSCAHDRSSGLDESAAGRPRGTGLAHHVGRPTRDHPR